MFKIFYPKIRFVDSNKKEDLEDLMVLPRKILEPIVFRQTPHSTPSIEPRNFGKYHNIGVFLNSEEHDWIIVRDDEDLLVLLALKKRKIIC